MLHPPKPDILLPAGFQLEGDLEKAFDLMENTSSNVFITGNAGTGKSSLLNYFRKYSRKNHIVLAPTGVAAVNVSGMTIHSFFGLPFRIMKPFDPDIAQWGKNSQKAKLLKAAKVIIIDEVSMVRADILDAVSYHLQIQSNNLIEPFGGKQIILIGDVYQLNPIEDKNGIVDDPDEEQRYKSPYFFSAEGFKKGRFEIIELQKIYRQTDDSFINLLNTVRNNQISYNELQVLNERCIDPDTQREDLTITLSTTNKIATDVNKTKLDELTAKEFVFEGKVHGDYPDHMLIGEKKLCLKEGAQIMMLNNDYKGRWVNGTLGKISSLSTKEIKVEFDKGRTETVEQFEWENKVYRWDKETSQIVKDVKGTFKQFPLKLAWAITIHKSQGLTFDKVIIDIGRGAFAHGQVYVALSRCRSMSGIFLKTPIRQHDIRVDPIVNTFRDWYRRRI